MKRILITGGGSGGHVSAATGLIQALLKKDPKYIDNILYVGGKLVTETGRSGQSVEQTRFEGGKIPFIAIRAGKLQRYFNLNTIKLIFGAIGGFIDANKVIKDFKPDLIFSTGGFVSVPVCFAGWIKKKPVYLHEQTAAVGLSNKIVSRFAKKVFITFPQSAKYFPKSEVIHSGNLVRPQIWEINEKTEIAKAIKKMKEEQDKYPIIYISGGGQGAHTLNVNIRQTLNYALEEFQIVLQIGDNTINKDYEVLVKEWQKLPEKLKTRFFPVKFVKDEEIGYVFKHSDIYIGRAGANTVYEMGLLKKPSIFIPIPWVTHNEQLLNAQTLVDCGLAKILPEGELTAEKLMNEMRKFVTDWRAGKYKCETKKIESVFILHAEDVILKEILD